MRRADPAPVSRAGDEVLAATLENDVPRLQVRLERAPTTPLVLRVLPAAAIGAGCLVPGWSGTQTALRPVHISLAEFGSRRTRYEKALELLTDGPFVSE